MIGRLLAVGVFGIVAAANVPVLWDAAVKAAGHPTFAAIALAVFYALRFTVTATFAVLVAIRPPSARASRSPVAFVACAAAIYSLVALHGPSASTSAATVAAGDTLTVIACLWQLVAVLTLGRCFGILPEARGLVTRGPYRLVRHPVYLGEFGACAGLVFAAPTIHNVVCAAGFVVAQSVRMRLEEQALTAEFPEYASYAASTPRVVPRIGILARRSGAPLARAAREQAAS